MSNILFIVMPTKGHVNALYGFAKELQILNHVIYITGGIDSELDYLVKCYGFNVIDLKSVPFGLKYHDELNYYKRFGKNTKDVIISRLYDTTYFERQESFSDILKLIKPQFIFLDSFLGMDYLCLYPLIFPKGIQLFFINTMSGLKKQNMPPCNTSLLPNERFKIKLSTFKNIIKIMGDHRAIIGVGIGIVAFSYLLVSYYKNIQKFIF